MKRSKIYWASSLCLFGLALAAATGTLRSTPAVAKDKTGEGSKVRPGDWNQWAGGPARNNTPEGKGIPTSWDLKKGTNVKWVSQLGSQTYGNPVIANGKIWVGTNNGGGWIPRYPAKIDLGALLCFDEKDGKFLWQHSSEKLPTGRVHDWPLQGICAAPLVEGDRLWFVTSRGEVRCLDTEGFLDGEDDGITNDWGTQAEILKGEDPASDQHGPAVAGFKAGKLSPGVLKMVGERGVKLPAETAVTAAKEPNTFLFTAKVGEADRDFRARVTPGKITIERHLSVNDKDEADVIWVVNMMTELGISQHNMCSCSVTAIGDVLFVNTSNGVDEGHLELPSPKAPTFLAMDKNTGKVLWSDNSPGANVLHGQWSSPAYGVLGGVPQVLFGGGDGWLYSFDPKGENGKAKLLWKFDCNPKKSKYLLGGRATRNHLIATPVIYNDLVYIAVGEDPEHGEGDGHLWCIDPKKRGDVSPTLVFNKADPSKPIEHKRLQACEEDKGDMERDNPNSAAVWHYTGVDTNGNKKLDFEETMHRTCGTVTIKDDIVYIADFSGLVHAVDAKTGKPFWTHDMLAASWSSALVVDGHVFIGDEDGDVSIFKHSKEEDSAEPVAEISMLNSVYTTPVVANNILYIANKTHLFAIEKGAQLKDPANAIKNRASGGDGD